MVHTRLYMSQIVAADHPGHADPARAAGAASRSCRLSERARKAHVRRSAGVADPDRDLRHALERRDRRPALLEELPRLHHLQDGLRHAGRAAAGDHPDGAAVRHPLGARQASAADGSRTRRPISELEGETHASRRDRDRRPRNGAPGMGSASCRRPRRPSCAAVVTAPSTILWQTSAHANAMTSPIFLDALDAAESEFGVEARKTASDATPPRRGCSTTPTSFARSAGKGSPATTAIRSARSRADGPNPKARSSSATSRAAPRRTRSRPRTAPRIRASTRRRCLCASATSTRTRADSPS